MQCWLNDSTTILEDFQANNYPEVVPCAAREGRPLPGGGGTGIRDPPGGRWAGYMGGLVANRNLKSNSVATEQSHSGLRKERQAKTGGV